MPTQIALPFSRPPGIVVGMRAEARLLAGTGLPVAIGGGAPAGATVAAERLIAEGAPGLISLGLAGGLDPALPPGTCVIPGAVVEHGRHFAVDAALARWLGGVTAPVLAAAVTAVGSPGAKAALFAATGAAAVDLESGAVAAVAARHGIPFAALRIICDPAWRGLPPAALAGLDSSGGIVLLPLIASLLRRPMQLPALFRLAGDARTARTALAAAVKRLGSDNGVKR